MQKNDLEETVVPEIEALGFECVMCEVAGTTRSPLVRLYIDKPGGVTIDDCSLVSRAVGMVLDEKDPFPGRYLLEVSSPGNNRPLTTRAHFERFAGKEAKVQVRGGSDGAKTTYTGKIGPCTSDGFTLETDAGEVAIGFDDIVTARLAHQEYKIDKKMKKERRPRTKRPRGKSR